jgi:hypothetical protein
MQPERRWWLLARGYSTRSGRDLVAISQQPGAPFHNGGEGDRTPDLVNAIHALSQLSYAPITFSPARAVGPAQRAVNLSRVTNHVKENRSSVAICGARIMVGLRVDEDCLRFSS